MLVSTLSAEAGGKTGQSVISIAAAAIRTNLLNGNNFGLFMSLAPLAHPAKLD
jgi:hypothetical protein